ncbi:hypothetical protein MMC09_000529 [Bachmanniomyces sp. S44760]|nr:hypothetical protein [Bachmanniomyces sp. S44760]
MGRDVSQDYANNPKAALYHLQQPENLQSVLKMDNQYNCLTCRLTGAAALFGLGGYSFLTGRYQLQQQRTKILRSGSRFGMKSRQTGITGIAMTFVGLGIYRLIN